jgi:DNA polymerase-3 subunit delta'
LPVTDTAGGSPVTDSAAGGVFATVHGQPEAVRALQAAVRSPVHAYLLVGPHGVGLRQAGIALAAALLCPDGGCGVCAHCRSALAESHPDLSIFERKGASVQVGQLQEAVQRSMRSPSSASRHVLILNELHLVGTAAPVLLKAIEEPPATTVFIVLAESVPPELETIASRCARIDLRPLDTETVRQVLLAEGFDAERAESAAAASGGRLDRARLLGREAGFADRQQRWRELATRGERTGAELAAESAALLASIEEPVAAVVAAQQEEMASLLAEAQRRREPLRARVEIDARHRREQRRVRTDELRGGLQVLAETYRQRLAGPAVRPADVHTVATAVAAIDEVSTELVRNPNEALLLQGLLIRLQRAQRDSQRLL